MKLSRQRIGLSCDQHVRSNLLVARRLHPFAKWAIVTSDLRHCRNDRASSAHIEQCSPELATSAPVDALTGSLGNCWSVPDHPLPVEVARPGLARAAQFRQLIQAGVCECTGFVSLHLLRSLKVQCFDTPWRQRSLAERGHTALPALLVPQFG